MSVVLFFFQAEDGIRDLVRSRGLGDVYKRQGMVSKTFTANGNSAACGVAMPSVTLDNGTQPVSVLSLIHI